MKVSDVIKITSDRTEVVIWERQEYQSCNLGEVNYDECNDAIDGRCGECEHNMLETSMSNLFVGFSGDVPIKLAERRVKEISAEDWTPKTPARRRYEKAYLFVEVTR